MIPIARRTAGLRLGVEVFATGTAGETRIGDDTGAGGALLMLPKTDSPSPRAVGTLNLCFFALGGVFSLLPASPPSTGDSSLILFFGVEPAADPKERRLATSPAVCIPDFLGVALNGLGDGPKIFRFVFSGDFCNETTLDADEVVGRAKEGVPPLGRVMEVTRGDLGVMLGPC